jgi:putative phage-type endonuclease
MRAYYYHQLVRYFGGVPIVDKSFSLADTEFLSKRNTMKECIAFIEKECDESAALLTGTMAAGRASRAAALALKSRILIYAASDLYDAVYHPITLIKKKLKNVSFNSHSIPALKWGCMFEQAAVNIYSHINSTKVNEFGLLVNNNINNFGASPDGITDEGIMIEIKCPYSREIKDKVIPEKYYYQMQGQMAVCELDICDYIECKFKAFNDIDEYFIVEKLTFDELKNMETAKNGWYGGNSEQKTKYLFKALQDYNVEILRDYFNINDNKILIDDIRKYCDDRLRFIEDLRVRKKRCIEILVVIKVLSAIKTFNHVPR